MWDYNLFIQFHTKSYNHIHTFIDKRFTARKSNVGEGWTKREKKRKRTLGACRSARYKSWFEYKLQFRSWKIFFQIRSTFSPCCSRNVSRISTSLPPRSRFCHTTSINRLIWSKFPKFSFKPRMRPLKKSLRVESSVIEPAKQIGKTRERSISLGGSWAKRWRIFPTEVLISGTSNNRKISINHFKVLWVKWLTRHRIA